MPQPCAPARHWAHALGNAPLTCGTRYCDTLFTTHFGNDPNGLGGGEKQKLVCQERAVLLPALQQPSERAAALAPTRARGAGAEEGHVT